MAGGVTTTTTYAYNAKGWLTTTSAVTGSVTTVTTNSYDGNGNLLSKSKAVGSAAAVVTTYTYDIWNNMTKSVSGGKTVENSYDGAGLRYGKKVNGGAMTISLYEYDDVVLEINATTNAQVAVNVYGNQLISRNGEHFMYNGHGDVTAIVDASSNVKASYYYDAFGVHTSATGSAGNPYRYAGYMYDEETGLYYLKSRYYDPETARFLSEDTYRGRSGDPLSLNLYAYAKYNPLRYFDPTGHVVSDTDKANLTPTQQAMITQYTKDWEAANAKYQNATTQAQKNAATKAMQAANDGANAVRAKANYSGGTNGDSINVSSGKTVETVVVNKTTTVSNNGTITNVNVNNGVTTSITNKGTIVTLNNKGTITTLDNSGKINTVVNTGSIGNIYNTGSMGTVNNSGNITTVTNTGTIGTINNKTSSSTIETITNSGTINTINNTSGTIGTINSNSGTISTINNDSRITGTITTGANCNTTINNAGFISGISIRENSSVIVNNTAIISRLTVWENGTLDGVNAGEVGYQYIFDGGKSTNKWEATSAAPLSFINNAYVLNVFALTNAEINAGVGVSRIDGMFYKDFSNPVNSALANAESEFMSKNRLDFRWFMDQVNHEGPWDIKVADGKPWNGTIAENTFPGQNTKIVVNGQITTAHELGNITYGYLGTAMGWTELELLIGGDFAAGSYNGGILGGLKGIITRADSEEDKAEIRAGIRWYKNR